MSKNKNGDVTPPISKKVAIQELELALKMAKEANANYRAALKLADEAMRNFKSSLSKRKGGKRIKGNSLVAYMRHQRSLDKIIEYVKRISATT